MNPYAASPLYVAQADPTTGKYVRAFFFLGSVPRTVFDAARRCRPTRADPRRPEWSQSDAAVLRGHYGEHWRELLTAEDPPAEADQVVTQTGRVFSFFVEGGWDSEIEKEGGADFDSFDDIAEEKSNYYVEWSNRIPGPPVYTDVAVYPEDTVFDLRLKLQVATGIPLYRAHLFYYVNEEGPAYPYRVTIDSAPDRIDWRKAGASDSADAGMIAGLSVDSRLEEQRESVHIEALDTFTLLGSRGTRVTRAYFVDLFAVLPPLGAPERPNDNLAAAIRDKYQFDLLYYGALLRYWPLLSPDACSVALSEPGRLSQTYPSLDPDTEELRGRFIAEKAIARNAHAWRPAAAKTGRQTLAVTAATVRVPPEAVRVRVAVRNVFDWVPLSPTLVAAVVRFESSTVAKRHLSSYKKMAPAVDAFLGRAQRRDTLAYAIARGDAPPAFMTVRADGVYEATATWREDDRVDFEAVAREIAAVVRPVVAAVNAMGAAAFPVGGSLSDATSGTFDGPGGLSAVGAITASAFWPHALSAAAFREVKARFRAYETAGIISVRGLQQGGAYAFFFRKGVVDAGGAARTEVEAPRSVQNQYAWLTEAAAAGRWAAAFPGRPVRIYHRATDLRVEVVSDSLEEFELIRRYLFSFLDATLAGPNRVRVGDTAIALKPPIEGVATRRLRRLQERDPNLFDLKKFDPGATVYSVLCQAGRQPHVYAANEIGALSAKRKAALVKYWNFTENVPAYYECPNPRYSHLSFRAGEHPLGFCLPCCKKTRPVEGSRAALVNTACLARRENPSEELGPALSRHVLAYGKAVPVGRVSETAPTVGDGLFLGAVPKPYRLYQVGVEQTAPAVPAAGYAYALAHAVAEGDTKETEILAELAAMAGQMTDTFHALGGGAGAAFASARDLADTILGAFVRRDAALSPFGPGGASAERWPAILAELARHAYGVETVLLADPAGDVTIEASRDAESAKRVVLLASSPAGTYPVAALNPRYYLRTIAGHRWMAVRRVFEFDAKPLPGVLEDRVVATLREALALAVDAPTTVIDLGLVTRFVATAPAFRVVSRICNLHNQCYAVLLEKKKTQVILPVQYSEYPLDGTPVYFGPRPEIKTQAEALAEVVKSLNEYIRRTKEPYAEITEARPIVDDNDRKIGFMSQGLAFLHEPAGQLTSSDDPVRFQYDPREIDNAIYDHIRGKAPAGLSKQAEAALYQNRLYHLFTAEFADILRADRDEQMRAGLTAAIRATKFDSAASLVALRRRLVQMLPPGDAQAVRKIIGMAYAAGGDVGAAALKSIAATTFGFDGRRLRELRALSRPEIAAKVRAMMTDRIEVTDAPSVRAPNLYVACSSKAEVDKGQCLAKLKLAVPAGRVDDFYDILAADIKNGSKLFVSAGVFDPLEFIKRPGEHLIFL